jgi:hypothetical protein
MKQAKRPRGPLQPLILAHGGGGEAGESSALDQVAALASQWQQRRRGGSHGANNASALMADPPDISMHGLGLDPSAVVEDDMTPMPEPEFYEPRLLPSRKRERARLGKASRSRENGECFLCAYVGERDTTLPSDDVAKMVEMIRQNLGRMLIAELAVMVADYYATFRQRINSTLTRGERPLPPMSAATVAEHIRQHQSDPQAKQTVMLEELQELRQELLKICIEKHNKHGTKRANNVNLSSLERVVKLELLVQSKDPTKMAFYSAGALVNPTSASQGPAAVSSKTLFSYWSTQRGGSAAGH